MEYAIYIHNFHDVFSITVTLCVTPVLMTSVEVSLEYATSFFAVTTHSLQFFWKDDERSNVSISHQGKFGSQWLKVGNCEIFGLLLDDQQLWILIASGFGANICVAQKCHCCKS